MNDTSKGGTRIFKKATPNQKLTIYLGKRDFYDHQTHVDPIEGVVLLDPNYVKGRKVFVSLHGALRFGRSELDSGGLHYRKEFFSSIKQLYPSKHCYSNGSGNFSKSLEPPSLTRLQERLIRKLGSHAHPFFFQLPAYSAASVCLHRPPSELKKTCRFEYELRVYVADDQRDAPQKRNSVCMVVRKLSCVPEGPGVQPSAEITKEFLVRAGSLRLEASLDKQHYYHGENLYVNVLVDNNSCRIVKKIKISVKQYTQLSMSPSSRCKSTVTRLKSDIGFPINPSQTGWCKVYRLCPSIEHARPTVGLATDGDLKHGHANLASSTIFSPQHSSAEARGIVVKYTVKIHLILGFGISDVLLELPFILAHRSTSETVGEDHDEFQHDVQLSPLGSSTPTQHPVAGEPARNGSVVANGHARSHLQRFVTSTNADHTTLQCVVSKNPFGYASSKSDRPLSGTNTQSTISEEDVLFEDFARLRLLALSPTIPPNSQP